MDDLKFAIPASMMLTTLAVLLFVFGGELTRIPVAAALLLGGLGQWLAQEEASFAFQVAGVIMNWLAVLSLTAAVFTFAVA